MPDVRAREDQTQERPLPLRDVILDCLEGLDVLREQQRTTLAKLDNLIKAGDGGEPRSRIRCRSELDQVQAVWREFIAAGGISADDLRCFLRGEPFGGPTRVVQRQHLRLVSSAPSLGELPRYKPPRESVSALRSRLLSRRRRYDNDGDAA
jgi:hypothetical protein